MARSDYGELGNILNDIAHERGVDGAYRIANHVQQKTGQGPTGSAWYQILRGETKQPERKNIMLFIEAFEVTGEERQALMNAYLFQGLAPAAA
jgi:hypothetical protein